MIPQPDFEYLRRIDALIDENSRVLEWAMPRPGAPMPVIRAAQSNWQSWLKHLPEMEKLEALRDQLMLAINGSVTWRDAVLILHEGLAQSIDLTEVERIVGHIAAGRFQSYSPEVWAAAARAISSRRRALRARLRVATVRSSLAASHSRFDKALTACNKLLKLGNSTKQLGQASR